MRFLFTFQTLLVAVIICARPVFAAVDSNTIHQVIVSSAESDRTVLASELDIGTHVGVGDRITIHEKSGRIIELLVEEISTAKLQTAQPDIPGTYVSEITTDTHWVFQKQKHRGLVLTISQNGDDITGLNEAANLKISGTLKGDNVTFFTWPSDITNSEIKGYWKINADGSKWEGKWSHPHGSGKWNLTRIRGKAVISDTGPLVIKGSLISDQANVEVKFADIAAIEVQRFHVADDSSSTALSDIAADKECRLSEAARKAIDRAEKAAMQDDKINVDALDLIDRAEAAAGPPECDNDKAIALAYQARLLAEREPSSAESSAPTTESTDPSETGKKVTRFKCDPDDFLDFGGVNPGPDPYGVIVSTTFTTTMTFALVSCASSQSSTDASNQNNSEYSEIRQRLFVRSVGDKLAADISRGGGEHLVSMAYLEGCPAETHDRFARLARQNFAQIFSDSYQNTDAILNNIEALIAADPRLASTCSLSS